MRRGILTLLAAGLVLAAALAGCSRTGEAAPAAAVTPEPVTLPVRTPSPNPVEDQRAPLSLADQGGHPALMRTSRKGNFSPENGVTKRELCEMLCPLLEGLLPGEAEFTDLQEGDKGYETVASMYAAGLLPEQAGEPFGPDEQTTRKELAYILRRLAEALTAEEAERTERLAEDVSAGLSVPDTDPVTDEYITRAELAAVLVRLADREVRGTALFIAERLPRDMHWGDYAWDYVADAVTEGDVPDPEPGVHRIYGWLYATWEDGSLVTDMDYGVWTFGMDGRYTTGSAELDEYLEEYLAESGAEDLPDEEALQAAYLYVKYNYVYQILPEDMEGEGVGEMGWEYERALRFFRYGGGPCYGYAAAFGLMARALGRTAYIVSAEVNEYHGQHAFVVIPEGDTDYIYDVELEATRQERHADLELYRMLNYTIYNYWYESDWRDP